MVFEQLYSAEWLEKKATFAFIMGFSYAVLGIFSAMLLFPQDPGLVAVAFTSLLLLPSLNKLLAIEENVESREQTFNFWLLFRDHRDIVRVYLFLFIGILLAFSFFAIMLPTLAASNLFQEQTRILGISTGNAFVNADFGTFTDILLNNLRVLLFCLIASLVYGAGSIFIITWNASVWGTIFGIVAKDSALIIGQNPFVYFALTILAVFPHMIAEALAYFLGAIAGGVVSKATIRETFGSSHFNHILLDALIIFGLALIVVAIGAYIEVYITHRVMSLLGV
ncbi:stage II sporulation protein M [Candidatus Woesearchaeota archaeon]|nr:stage II sporulation protein M [Candidatus Woesearchaeota archaeon]